MTLVILVMPCLASLLPTASPVLAIVSATAWAWGINSSGQLGDNTTNNADNPVQVSGLTGVVSVAVGISHSLAVKSDGTVWAWGANSDGRLGDNTTSDSHTPVQVIGLSGTTNVSAGAFWSMALKSDGTVWDWGSNTNGQLGDNTTDNSPLPVQVKDASGSGNLTGITAIAGGDYWYSLALKSDGTVWAWGNNDDGQLGDGTQFINRLLPVQVKDTAGTGNLTGITAISAGFGHNLALKSDGTVWAWGLDNLGQLGDNTTSGDPSLLPVQVKDAAGTSNLTNIVAIAAGYQHSLAVKSDGTVWAWGSNDHGELGDNTTSVRHLPVQVIGLSGVTAVAGGAYNSVALKSDGTVWIWGENWIYSNVKLIPVQKSGFSGAIAITAKYYHSLAIKSAASAPLSITTTSLSNGAVGVAYNQTLAASGGTAPYNWSITSGSLPAGLLLNATTGLISGTPTASVGPTLITFTVTDYVSATASQALSIIITAPTNGLIAWWRAEGNANDSIGNNDGTLMGGTTFTAGKTDQAFSFNGTSQSVSLPDSLIPSNPAWTVVTWFKTSSGGGLLGMQDLPNSHWDPFLFVGTDGLLHGGAWGSAIVSSENVSDGNWHHAAISYSSNITLYLDGVQAGSVLAPSPFPSEVVNQIGTAYTVFWPNAADGWFDFNGQIDECALFNRPLSSVEINAIYNYGIITTPVITTNSLPSGTRGTSYHTTLAASDGSGTYTWSISAGSLPAGLTLTGNIISGTPTTAGTYSFTVQVSDGIGAAIKPLSITVNAPTPAPSGGGGGVGILYVSLSGLNGTLMITIDGTAVQAALLVSQDNNVSLFVPNLTKLHNSLGNPLTSLSVTKVPSPPAPPPGQLILSAYDFTPNGAMFGTALTLIMSYDPKTLPKGSLESDLYIAYWDGSQWVALVSVVDTNAHTVSAFIIDFTNFAVMSKLAPAPAPTPTPTPTQTSTPTPTPTTSPTPTPTPKPTPTPTLTPTPTPTLTPTPAPTTFQPAPPTTSSTNWALIGGITGGVIVAGLIIFFLVRGLIWRRR